MKFIKNGIIYEPHNEFVIEQMKKSGYQVYDEVTKEEEPKKEVEEPKKEVEVTEEKPKEAPKKKKK